MRETYKEDLLPLYQKLVARKVKCEMRIHPVVKLEPDVKKLIGYYPTGEHQIIIEHEGNRYSVIRGMASFGSYEIMNTSGGEKFKDPKRFSEPQKLIFDLLTPPSK